MNHFKLVDHFATIENMRQFTEKEKKFFVTTAFILGCLIFFAFFEEVPELSSVIQGFIIAFIFFLCLPLAFCRFVLREPLTKIGFQQNFRLTYVLLSVIVAFVGFIALWFLQQSIPEFGSTTFFPVKVETSFFWFVLYALTVVPITLIVYEVFFRGLVQILWLENKWWAIVVQAGLFALLTFFSQGISLDDTPLLLAAILSGFVAYRTGSLWYALGTSYILILLTDILFLSLR